MSFFELVGIITCVLFGGLFLFGIIFSIVNALRDYALETMTSRIDAKDAEIERLNRVIEDMVQKNTAQPEEEEDGGTWE